MMLNGLSQILAWRFFLLMNVTGGLGELGPPIKTGKAQVVGS